MRSTLLFLLTLAMTTVHGQVKWNSVEKVYSNLITAIGDGSKIAPPIKSSRTESRVAYYSPSRQTVFVEEKFLKVCADFGPDSLNALAFILGHELAHFYRNHGWVSANGMGYVDAEIQKDWKGLKQDVTNHAKDETEADIFSGFYALVAGYIAMPVAGKTLKTLYSVYGIPDSVVGYPTLGQRINIAENAMKKSQDLFVLFNVGLYCIATQKFEVASKLYTHIYNQDYSGAEILNNLATSEILLGYKMLNESPLYYYPVFVSTETPLDPNSRGSEGEEHIRTGISYLKDALKKEDDNTSVMINLASAFAMLNEFVDAEYYLAKASAKDADENAVACLEGIIASKKGDSKTAKKIWKEYKDESVFIAKNYSSIYSKKQNGSGGSINNETYSAPIIDNVDLSDPGLKRKFDYTVIKLPGLKVSYVDLEKSTLVEVYGGSGIDYRFQRFKSNNFETTDYMWDAVLKSSTSSVSNSKNYNVLKVESHDGLIPEYIKYVWY